MHPRTECLLSSTNEDQNLRPHSPPQYRQRTAFGKCSSSLRSRSGKTDDCQSISLKASLSILLRPHIRQVKIQGVESVINVTEQRSSSAWFCKENTKTMSFGAHAKWIRLGRNGFLTDATSLRRELRIWLQLSVVQIKNDSRKGRMPSSLNAQKALVNIVEYPCFSALRQFGDARSY
jgi:hypothetical protein